MSKSSVNTNFIGSKNIYNEVSLGLTDKEILNILQSSGAIPTTDQFGAVATSGNQVFGVIAADTATVNATTILQKLLIGDGGLFQVVPQDQRKINEMNTYSVLLTTNQYSDTGTVGYTSINFNIPYVFNDPDHVPVAANKEAPDNYLNFVNTKFKVSGPITSIQSIKTTFTAPVLTLNYFDRPGASLNPVDVLKMKQWEEGLVMERLEEDRGAIKFSFMGYSQPLDRFVFYKTGRYTGTEPYNYINRNGSINSETGILNEYNIDRIHYDPTDITQDPADIVTKVDIDSLFINDINSADHTASRKININAYDDLTITVGADPNEGILTTRNYDYNLSVRGKTTLNGTGDMKIHGSKNVTIEAIASSGSSTAVYINPGGSSDLNTVPVYMGNSSMVQVNNYLQSTNFLSTGITGGASARNRSTAVEFGGTFVAPNLGRSSQLLIDGTNNSFGVDDSHLVYSSGTVNIPTNNLNISSSGTTNVSNMTLRPLNLNIGTNSSVQKSCTLCVTGATTNAAENYSIYCDQGIVKFKGPNNSYMSWQDDALNLYNARIYVNPQPGSFVPYIDIGTTGKQTSVYALTSLPDVSGSNELYVDGISTRIPLFNGNAYTLTGTITAIQAGNIGCAMVFECYMTVIGGRKHIFNQSIRDIHNNDNAITSNRIFDFFMSFSGDPVNFVGGIGGDCFVFTGISTNGLPTRWLASMYVAILAI